MAYISFPKDFYFGTATAAYQIEGAWNEDGKGESIWDRFAHTPGKTRSGQTGDVTCDHYHRYKEDVALMKSLNVNSYRFSIAWPRIFPEGKGRVEQRGIDFYSRLVDELLNNGITPFITLYHWDMPQILWDNYKGWLSRDVSKYFAEYAATVFDALGDRVKNWITFNEPKNCYGHAGYRDGGSAPGYKGGMKGILHASHHMYLAHGLTVQAFRDMNMNGEIGITEAAGYPHPLTDDPKDLEAVKIALEYDLFWHVDAIFKGHYPELVKSDLIYPYMPAGFENDYPVISTPIDFLGINCYRSNWISYDPNWYLNIRFNDPAHLEKSGLGWPITPEGMYDILTAFNQRVPGVKLYITENGYATSGGAETPDKDGRVHDQFRTDFYKRYLANAKRAMDEGVNLKGYFFWSFLDNLEWGSGFDPRFGIVYVDFDTLKRYPKDTALWYTDMIAEGGFEL